MKHQNLIDTALDLGLSGAVVFPAAALVTDRAFRAMCADNRCGMYGKCWTCPPDAGDIDELIAKLGEFDTCLLYQTITDIEDSYDFEGMQEAGNRHATLGRTLAKRLLPEIGSKSLHLGAGGCRFCPRCAKRDGLPCRAPAEALSSMEAYGIDVYKTVSKTALKYINGQNTVTYFGVILF
ncbi:MAG: DUF2284 domain-containing protein [Clostridia bacterium]|nr:DUF2284 domain-containing protein [Clostridia bacterium]